MDDQLPVETQLADEECIKGREAEQDIQEHGFVRLRPRTHDISFIDHHISDIQKVGADLDAAIQAVWPKRHESRYSQVHALLISWEEDDLGVCREIAPLKHVLEEKYHFDVREYRIPDIHHPVRALASEVNQFLTLWDGQDSLLLIYYAGHATRAPEENSAPLWCANRMSPEPAIPSGIIQGLFEEADSDVFLIYDCCHSAGVPTVGCNVPTSGRKQKHHVVEIIAACGYETVAPEVDQHSFSKALTQVLALSATERLSVGILHSKILRTVKCWAPSLQVDLKGKFAEDDKGRPIYERQPRRTPIHTLVCETEPRRSIVLGAMPNRDGSGSSISTPGRNTPSPSPDPDPSFSNDNVASGTSTGRRKRKRNAEDDGPCPQILLTIRLERSELDTAQWKEWIRNLPASGTDIHVEGVYRSFSTLLLIRMPVAIWNLLSSNTAYDFVGFVTSENLVHQMMELSSTIPTGSSGDSIANSSATQSTGGAGSDLQHSKMSGKTDAQRVKEDSIQGGLGNAGSQVEGASSSSWVLPTKSLGDRSIHALSSDISSSPSDVSSPNAKRVEVNPQPASTNAPLAVTEISTFHDVNKRTSSPSPGKSNFDESWKVEEEEMMRGVQTSPPTTKAFRQTRRDAQRERDRQVAMKHQQRIKTLPGVSSANTLSPGSVIRTPAIDEPSLVSTPSSTTALSRGSPSAPTIPDIQQQTTNQFTQPIPTRINLRSNITTTASSVSDLLSFQTSQSSHSHSSSHNTTSKRERAWHWEQFWYCCQCHPNGGGPVSIWSEYCSSCAHTRDSYCSVENIKIYDDR